MAVSWIGRSMVIGIVADLVLLLIVWYILLKSKGENTKLSGLFKTRDGYYSLANFQFFVWTLVFIFALTTVYFVRLFNGNFNPIESIPQQLLLLIGISVAVTPISGAISEIKYPEMREDSKEDGKDKDKDNGKDDSKDKSFAGMLKEGGMPNITRYQMFAWTLISTFIYLFILYSTLFNLNLDDIKDLTLPDIDTTLVFLMGLSQAGYIGGKLVAPNETKITYISPPENKPGHIISISGFDFGDQEGSVELGDKSADVIKWTRTKIEVIVPQMDPDTYKLRVIANGRLSKPFAFKVLKDSVR